MHVHCDSRITHLPIELQIEMIRLPIECMDIVTVELGSFKTFLS